MGAAGAALMDLWSWFLRRAWGIPTLDYAMLGRWVGHMPRGRFRHGRIAVAAPIRGERVIGWLAHYVIGIAFAIPVLVIGGPGWLDHPTLAPAMVVAMATIVAPWFVMQPAMGAGVAGSRTPSPRATRLRNLGTHAVYGAGLYASAVLLSLA
jgi:hypothetical protein